MFLIGYRHFFLLLICNVAINLIPRFTNSKGYNSYVHVKNSDNMMQFSILNSSEKETVILILKEGLLIHMELSQDNEPMMASSE